MAEETHGMDDGNVAGTHASSKGFRSKKTEEIDEVRLKFTSPK